MNDSVAQTPTDSKEWYLGVTPEQYEAMRAKGIEEEALLKPGRRVFRRRKMNSLGYGSFVLPNAK